MSESSASPQTQQLEITHSDIPGFSSVKFFDLNLSIGELKSKVFIIYFIINTI